MFTIITFILVLGILVLVHELGHFIAALKAGCDVEEFGIGFPPRVFKIKRNGILYSINLLPLGGYVKIKGENGGDVNDPGSFVSKSVPWKILIVSAGVMMNILLAYVFISIGLMIGSPQVLTPELVEKRFLTVNEPRMLISQVLPDSPASLADIQGGDIIISVDNEGIETSEELQGILGSKEISQHTFVLERSGETIETSVTPVVLEETGNPGVGIGFVETGLVSYPFYIAPFVGIAETGKMLWAIILGLWALLMDLIRTGNVSADVTGPIGIAVITGEVARRGILYILQFTAILSLNLAIINILPFPALDGNRLLLIIVEKIRGKQLNVKLEQIINLVGFGALMLLMLAVTIKDIRQYGQSLLDFFM